MPDRSAAADAGRSLRWIVSYVFLVIVGVTMLFPLAWMAATSLKSPEADALDLKEFLPQDKWHVENYSLVMGERDFERAFFNSALVTVAITFGLVATSSLAAFAFARLSFAGRDKLFFGYLATMMVPGAVTMIPLFILLRQLGWINTYAALIVPPMFSAYGVFMLRQFFLTLPRELEEAAEIDGCSPFGIYWRVTLPLSRPALAALAILTFIGTWRSFMWPLIVTHTPNLFTLPLALARYQEMFGVQWPYLMAGSVILVLPMLLVFVLGQKFFVEGIQIGAVKG
jgi:multiple sugar transport system permease protein